MLEQPETNQIGGVDYSNDKLVFFETIQPDNGSTKLKDLGLVAPASFAQRRTT